MHHSRNTLDCLCPIYILLIKVIPGGSLIWKKSLFWIQFAQYKVTSVVNSHYSRIKECPIQLWCISHRWKYTPYGRRIQKCTKSHLPIKMLTTPHWVHTVMSTMYPSRTNHVSYFKKTAKLCGNRLQPVYCTRAEHIVSAIVTTDILVDHEPVHARWLLGRLINISRIRPLYSQDAIASLPERLLTDTVTLTNLRWRRVTDVLVSSDQTTQVVVTETTVDVKRRLTLLASDALKQMSPGNCFQETASKKNYYLMCFLLIFEKKQLREILHVSTWWRSWVVWHYIIGVMKYGVFRHRRKLYCVVRSMKRSVIPLKRKELPAYRLLTEDADCTCCKDIFVTNLKETRKGVN